MIYTDFPHKIPFQYAIFGKVTKGDETLRKLEQLPTRREGIFVMVYIYYYFGWFLSAEKKT